MLEEGDTEVPSHLISLHELSARRVAGLFTLAANVKANPAAYKEALAGQSLAMIFQKSSTRTRVSFEVGMSQLGGRALFLSSRDIQLGRGETIEDTAKVLSRYVDGIMARTFAHSDVVDLAQYGTIPVINGLTDDLHPCQALADYFTLYEVFGELTGRTLAYIGDGNNVAHSLMLGAPKVGMNIAIASPKGYGVDEKYAELARKDAAAAGTKIMLTSSPDEAVRAASAVYTDVWASMGQEGETKERLARFEGFQVRRSSHGPCQRRRSVPPLLTVPPWGRGLGGGRRRSSEPHFRRSRESTPRAEGRHALAHGGSRYLTVRSDQIGPSPAPSVGCAVRFVRSLG